MALVSPETEIVEQLSRSWLIFTATWLSLTTEGIWYDEFIELPFLGCNPRSASNTSLVSPVAHDTPYRTWYVPFFLM
jgi:hypothetical protein